MNRNDLLELIPAYALNALDAEEKAAVEKLLQDDAEAQALLADYDAVAETLLYAVPVREAPITLREGLRTHLQSHPQPTTVQTPTLPIDSAPRTIRLQAIPWWVAIAASIIVLLGIIAILSPSSTIPQSNPAALYQQLDAASDTTRHNILPEFAEDAQGNLLVNDTGTQAVLRVSTLPDTTEEQSYQLWLITNDAVHSGGIFHWATGHGPYYIQITPDILDELVAVGMTIEPFEGSPLGNAPTGDRLFAVSVASAQ